MYLLIEMWENAWQSVEDKDSKNMYPYKNYPSSHPPKKRLMPKTYGKAQVLPLTFSHRAKLQPLYITLALKMPVTFQQLLDFGNHSWLIKI